MRKSSVKPGGAYTRNFNKAPRGKFKQTALGRGKMSRSKSRG